MKETEFLPDNLVFGMSLVSSAVDRRHDVLDYFTPLLIRSILALQGKEGMQIPADRICDHIKKEYGIHFPLKSAEVLIRRIGKLKGFESIERGKLIKVENTVRDTYQEFQDKRIRQFNELCNSYSAFAKENGVLVSPNDSAKFICSVLRLNATTFAAFLMGTDDKPLSDIIADIPETVKYSLAKFFETIRSSNENLFLVLRDTYFSVTMLALLELSETFDIPSIGGNVRVYLDTNFLMRLLGWATEYETRAANELFDMLKKHKIEPCVFQFTLDEYRRALRYYGDEAFKVLDLPVGQEMTHEDLMGIASGIRRQNLNRLEFEGRFKKLESEVGGKGISIITTSPITDQKLDKKEIEDLIYLKQHSRHNVGKNLEIINLEVLHDISAVTRVRQQRGGNIYEYRKAKAWFLTCDHRLYTSNRKRHTKRHSLPEAVVDYNFTTLLWLTSPQSANNAPIDQLLSQVAMNSKFDVSFLKYLDRYIKHYMEKNPASISYTEDIFIAMQLQENREELLEAQNITDEYEKGQILEGKFTEAITRKKLAEKKVEQDRDSMKEALTIATQEGEKKLARLRQQISTMEMELQDQKEKARIHEEAKAALHQYEKGKLLVLTAGVITLLFLTLYYSIENRSRFLFLFLACIPPSLIWYYVNFNRRLAKYLFFKHIRIYLVGFYVALCIYAILIQIIGSLPVQK